MHKRKLDNVELNDENLVDIVGGSLYYAASKKNKKEDKKKTKEELFTIPIAVDHKKS